MTKISSGEDSLKCEWIQNAQCLVEKLFRKESFQKRISLQGISLLKNLFRRESIQKWMYSVIEKMRQEYLQDRSFTVKQIFLG